MVHQKASYIYGLEVLIVERCRVGVEDGGVIDII